MKKVGRGSFVFDNKPYVKGYSSVGGVKEGEGPLGKKFDRIFSENLAGEDSWEKAESRFIQEAVNICIDKSCITSADVDMVFTGDLLNQCVASTFGLRSLHIPHIGMYGACSTMALTLLNAAICIDSGCADCCIAATSSHFSSAERQYRLPLQYGGQRTPTAQWTVSGSGAVSLSNTPSEVFIRRATVGIIDELGVKDANNMGAAMAPATANTLVRFFSDHNLSPDKPSVILTGDLGLVGSKLLKQLLQTEGIDISGNHKDGGVMIYNIEKQDMHAGGSGCGCSAVVLCSELLPRLWNGELESIVLVGTGALLSPTTLQQGEVIPGIAHAVELARA